MGDEFEPGLGVGCDQDFCATRRTSSCGVSIEEDGRMLTELVVELCIDD